MRKLKYINVTADEKRVDLTEIKKIEKIKSKELKEAAFRAGKASKMVSKIANVLTRKLGLKTSISSIPELYKNSQGVFEGYFGVVGPKGLRLNFLKGKNDLLKSIDIYDNFLQTEPNDTIELNGYNIVQVIDQITDVLSGEFERYDESIKITKKDKLTEARRNVKEMVASWLNDNPGIIKNLQNESVDYDKAAIDFIDYIHNEYNSSKKKIKPSTLQWNIRMVIEENPSMFNVNFKKVPGITVTPAPVDNVSLLSQPLQEMWKKVQNISPKQVIEDLEMDLRRIAQNDPLMPGLLIYGKPGTGKTQTVTDIFNEEGIKPVIVDEKLSAFSKLLNVLFTYKSNEIIILDDNDSIFDNEVTVDLLKKVLDMKPVRTIHLTNPVKIIGTNLTIEDDFDFESKMIFISNRLKMDSAIKSRLGGVMHEINFTKEEMLELIKLNLLNLYADIASITDDMRYKVYDFVEEIMPVVNDLDYRAFNYCLSFCEAIEGAGLPESTWKEKTMRFLKDYRKNVKGKKY